MTFLESLLAKIRGVHVPASALPKLLPPNKVIASSFADPKDVAAFKRCKAEGKTDLLGCEHGSTAHAHVRSPAG
jgi:hypothetical protein